MAIGLTVRVNNTRDNTTFERTFEHFPVRIGRNALNDLQLDLPFVSQFHAVVEMENGKLLLRDLGSRNGTLLRGSGRVNPNATVDLIANGYEFAIVTLIFHCQPAEVVPKQARKREGGAVLTMNVEETMKRKDAAPGVGSGEIDQMMDQLKPRFESYRAAWGDFFKKLTETTADLDPASRAILLRRVMVELPASTDEGDFKRLVTAEGPSANDVIGSTGAHEEQVALQGLKELAGWFVPGSRPLEGVAEVVAFLQRLQDTLDVFFKCYVPLRDGYKQFEDQMSIRRNRTAQHEVAKDPRALGAQLLNWRKEGVAEGARAVESTFADLMIHQVAVLSGVMRGVKSLLSELAPSSIERAVDKKGGGGGLAVGPFRFRALWEAYIARHGDLADEEKEAFGLIFGPEFATAYAQFAKEGNRSTGLIPATPAWSPKR